MIGITTASPQRKRNKRKKPEFHLNNLDNSKFRFDPSTNRLTFYKYDKRNLSSQRHSIGMKDKF